MRIGRGLQVAGRATRAAGDAGAAAQSTAGASTGRVDGAAAETPVICWGPRARREGERFRVKDVFWQHLLPVGGVTLTVVVLTLSLFDVPPHAREPVLGLRVPASATPVA